MDSSTIRIGSYTLAMRGCELIRKNGMRCQVRKCADTQGQYGCVYSLTVSGDRWRAESILRNAGIMVLP